MRDRRDAEQREVFTSKILSPYLRRSKSLEDLHEYQEWSKRSLKGRRYAYLWADGIYFNVRLESPESKK